MIVKQRLMYAVLLLGCVTTVCLGCSGGSGQTGNGREQLIPAVEDVQAQYGSLPLIERLSGVVKAKNQVEIFPEIRDVCGCGRALRRERTSHAGAVECTL